MSDHAARTSTPPRTDLSSWRRRTGAWIGIGTGPGTLMVAAGVAGEVGAPLALPAVLVGCGVLYILAVLHGLEGLRRRAPMGELVRGIFGSAGYSSVVTIAIMLATVGWCGFYVGVGGAALSDLLGWRQAAGAALIASICLGLALMGQNRWNALLYLTAGSAVALTLFTIVALPASPPTNVASRSLADGLVTGLGGVIAYAIVFTMRTPDFTFDLESERHVWLAGLTMLVPMVALMVAGVWLYARTGLFDMAGVLRRSERPEVGQLFLAFSAIAPAVTAVYSSAISIVSLKRIPETIAMAAVGGIAFALGAVRFDLRLIAFLQTLGAVVPAALTVMLLGPRLRVSPGPGRSFVAWVAGSAAALALRPIAPFWGFVAGSSTTALLLWTASLAQSRTLNGEPGAIGG